MTVKMNRSFYNISALKDWLRNKMFDCGSPEAYADWIYEFFEEGNTITVHGEEYDYEYCSDLI